MAKVNLFDSNSESYFGDQFRKEAWENALEIEPTIDRCTEYENAYVFSYPECRNTIGPRQSADLSNMDPINHFCELLALIFFFCTVI